MSKISTGSWVVMGVCGCGKSEIGSRLAKTLSLRFLEGDAFHSPANIEKMSSGIALTDADRADWLRTLRDELGAARARGEAVVLSCSALKRRYRALLREGDPSLRFAHLHGPRDIIERRMAARPGHYMPTSLLDSQLRDLEPLQEDEAGLSLDLGQPPEQLVDCILQSLAPHP